MNVEGLSDDCRITVRLDRISAVGYTPKGCEVRITTSDGTESFQFREPELAVAFYETVQAYILRQVTENE